MKETITETLHPEMQVSFPDVEILVHKKTKEQDLILARSDTLGLILMLDGVVQLVERDNAMYHEMLVHPALCTHKNAKNILIIGGGDGGALRHVLMHSVEKAVLVEIDSAVIDFSKKYFGNVCGTAFEDMRSKVIIADGAEYVAKVHEQYDLIIVDSTDPVGPGKALFEKSFYKNCMQMLRSDGILITQNGVPFLQSEELTETMSAFKQFFNASACYLATIPTYVGGPMAFGFGTNNKKYIEDIHVEDINVLLKERNIHTEYYNGDVHQAAFVLPVYIQKMLN